MELDKEKDIAAKNFARIAANIPSRLSEKEDRYAIKMHRSTKNSENKLASLYLFMTELYEYVSKFTPCKKGCSHCCHYSVSVSEIEIAYIEKHSKAKRRKTFLPKSNFHGSPCPFLKEGICSIYDARPFVCRRHVALTSENTWCNPSISNDEVFPQLKFSGIDEAFDQIRRESASFTLYDIRQAFDRYYV